MYFSLSNEAEALAAFKSFCRIWGSGGCGSLHLETQNQEVTLKLEQKLGPLHGLRPGPMGREAPIRSKHKSPSQLHLLERRPAEALSKTNTEPSEEAEKAQQKDETPKLHKQKSFLKCKYCNLDVENMTLMRTHIREYHRIPCPICG